MISTIASFIKDIRVIYPVIVSVILGAGGWFGYDQVQQVKQVVVQDLSNYATKDDLKGLASKEYVKQQNRKQDERWHR